MKKIFLAFAILMSSLAIVSCSDDDEKVISFSEVPAEAKKFITDHFTGFDESQVSYVEVDNDGTYEVIFNNRMEIDFYPNGVWKEIDMNGNTLPESIAMLIPTNALSYISSTYPNLAIEEIEKKGVYSETQGFKVELRGDIEIYFDYLGNVTQDKGNSNSGNEVVPVDQLPASVKATLDKYFKDQTPVVELEWDKYEITYGKNTTNEIEIEFYKDGAFKSVEADGDDTVLRAIIGNMKPSILTHINEKHSGFRIEEFAVTPAYLAGIYKDGYKVEVESGKTELDIYFDKDGGHIKTIQD